MSDKPPATSRSFARLAVAALVMLEMLTVLGVWIMHYAISMDESSRGTMQGANSIAARAVQHWSDVTITVQGKINGNSLSIIASNENFGDPANGIVKALRVNYAIDGSPGVRWVRENETLNIVAPPGKTLEIRQAIYGDVPIERDQPAPGDTGTSGNATNTADVTQRIQALIKDDQLTVEVSNAGMGSDPAFGKVKRLTIDYAVGGQEHTLLVDEGKTLHLPSDGDGAGKLAIVRATWAAK
jgi:hypothetical protein